jgi:sugar/nucleoside kinase (ribokinase family)
MRDTTNALSLVLVDKKTGDRTIVWSRHPGLHMEPNDVAESCVQSGRVLLVDGHEPLAARMAARYARKKGIPTVIDVEKVNQGIENLLHEIDVIITSESFPPAMTGEPELGQALRKLKSAFAPTMVCATLGAKGSLALVGDTEIRTPGFDVDVVDTTGAGDVFRGGFIGGWLLGDSEATVEEVLRYANAVAALSCQRLGAREGIPTAAEVERFLSRSR